MKYPETLKIGPFVWAIERPYRIRRREPEGLQDRWGEIDYTAEVIRVVQYAGPSQRVSTLIHEALHGIAYAYGIKDEELSEETIGKLAPGVYDFLLANGLLVDIDFDDEDRAEWIDAVARHDADTDMTGKIEY